jgi:hypothetical protein
MSQRSYILLAVFLFFGVAVNGQKTVVRGSVIDASTGEPLPFANIVYSHSTAGTISDFNGNFFIESTSATDTLVASSLGYIPEKLAVRKAVQQNLFFALQPTTLSIEEVVVRPGENPAFEILRRISANKPKNNPDRFGSYQYKAYNKLRLDLNNIDDNFKKQAFIRKFQFVFDYMDTSEVFGKNYLPILMSESVTHFYYRQNPQVEREIVEAFKISGIQNNTISQYSGKMYQRLNVYDNFMTLFEPGFVSPIADFGRLYYKYTLEDSAMIDDDYCFKISFQPKRKLERTFYGYFWVADTSYAIRKIQLRVAKDVNINFLNDLVAINEYKKVNDSTWFLSSEELLLDFYVTDFTSGFFGRKSSVYTDIKLDQPIPDSIDNYRSDVIADQESIKREDDYWEENRLAELTGEEAGVYQMVDSVTQVPAFERIYSLVEMLVDYYYVVGPFEIGPYYTLYSHNPVEGHRFRLGGRTSNNFSTKLRLGGHLAYGTTDEEFKYGLGVEYMFRTNPRLYAGIWHYHDVRQLGKSENAFLDDNFFANLLRRNPNNKLTLVDQYNAFLEREWYQGFSNTLEVRYQTIYATDYVPFEMFGEGGEPVSVRDITSTEITLKTHFAYREKYLLGKFERSSLGSRYPALDLDLTYGPKGFLNSDYEYFKIKLQISDKLETNPFGYLRYRLTGGKTFGTLPYPLLELHEGNETYAYDPLAFNMMNYYEFVSEEYITLSAEHHFQGFFLNKIPLMRWLGFREVATGKVLMGNLSDRNTQVMAFPAGLTKLSEPYYEAGIGLENILRIFRVDAMWRFSYLGHENIQAFGLRATMQLTF